MTNELIIYKKSIQKTLGNRLTDKLKNRQADNQANRQKDGKRKCNKIVHNIAQFFNLRRQQAKTVKVNMCKYY